MSLTYQCCFCGLSIGQVIPDIGSLFYTTCIDGPVNLQKDHEMYCHRNCLADRIHPSVHLYAAFLAE
jgi:hypothetical protein